MGIWETFPPGVVGAFFAALEGFVLFVHGRTQVFGKSIPLKSIMKPAHLYAGSFVFGFSIAALILLSAAIFETILAIFQKEFPGGLIFDFSAFVLLQLAFAYQKFFLKILNIPHRLFALIDASAIQKPLNTGCDHFLEEFHERLSIIEKRTNVLRTDERFFRNSDKFLKDQFRYAEIFLHSLKYRFEKYDSPFDADAKWLMREDIANAEKNIYTIIAIYLSKMDDGISAIKRLPEFDLPIPPTVAFSAKAVGSLILAGILAPFMSYILGWAITLDSTDLQGQNIGMLYFIYTFVLWVLPIGSVILFHQKTGRGIANTTKNSVILSIFSVISVMLVVSLLMSMVSYTSNQGHIDVSFQSYIRRSACWSFLPASFCCYIIIRTHFLLRRQ